MMHSLSCRGWLRTRPMLRGIELSTEGRKERTRSLTLATGLLIAKANYTPPFKTSKRGNKWRKLVEQLRIVKLPRVPISALEISQWNQKSKRRAFSIHTWNQSSHRKLIWIQGRQMKTSQEQEEVLGAHLSWMMIPKTKTESGQLKHWKRKKKNLTQLRNWMNQCHD